MGDVLVLLYNDAGRIMLRAGLRGGRPGNMLDGATGGAYILGADDVAYMLTSPSSVRIESLTAASAHDDGYCWSDPTLIKSATLVKSENPLSTVKSSSCGVLEGSY